MQDLLAAALLLEDLKSCPIFCQFSMKEESSELLPPPPPSRPSPTPRPNSSVSKQGKKTFHFKDKADFLAQLKSGNIDPLDPVQRPQVPTRQEPFQSSPTPRPPAIQFTSEASPFAVQNTTPLPNQRPFSNSPSQRPFSNSPTKRPRGRPNVSSTTR